MASSTIPESPFSLAPAPWACRGEAFWFLTYTSPAKAIYPAGDEFGELEADSPYADPKISGEFKGGLATVQVVRYTETPVGPYDEIIWIPGKFTVPGTNKENLRITRIYVSALDSVFNGRRNWNIPKTLATFTFHPSPAGSALPYQKITASLPSSPNTPFFSANLTPASSWLPAVPFSTSISPLDLTLRQPPLPESEKWREDARVGTEEWCSITPKMKGGAKVFWTSPGLEQQQGEGGVRTYGDGKAFPKGEGLWRWGVWLKDMGLEFGVGVNREEEGKKKK